MNKIILKQAMNYISSTYPSDNTYYVYLVFKKYEELININN